MSTTTQVRRYAIDPAHTAAHFSVRHLMISKVRGTFGKISGSLELPADSAIPASVAVTIDAASIETREPQRDTHLRSADFLDVENFPELKFTSTAVRPVDAATFEVTGNLEIHGTARPATIKVEVSGQGPDPWGNYRVAYEAAFKISRKDFGLVWNQALEAGGVAVGDEIDITLDVEAVPAA